MESEPRRGVRGPGPAVLVPAVALVVAATGVLGWTLWPRSAADGQAVRPASPGRDTVQRTTATQGLAEAAPGEASKGARVRVRYETVEQDYGYFEGTFTIVNRTGAPLGAWTLSFTYPAVNVRNAWEGILKQGGENVIITSKPGIQPIKAGDSATVEFGASGSPSEPTNCQINGQPCTFE